VYLLVGPRGLFAFTPLTAVAAYGFVVMWRSRGPLRRLTLAIGAPSIVFFFSIVFLQLNDEHARNFAERRYVDLFFVLYVALGPALTSIRSTLGAIVVRVAVAASVATAALGTLAPFAGNPGESGFAFAAAAFAELWRRAPVQGVLDVMLLLALVAVVLSIVEPALDSAPRNSHIP